MFWNMLRAGGMRVNKASRLVSGWRRGGAEWVEERPWGGGVVGQGTLCVGGRSPSRSEAGWAVSKDMIGGWGGFSMGAAGEVEIGLGRGLMGRVLVAGPLTSEGLLHLIL